MISEKINDFNRCANNVKKHFPKLYEFMIVNNRTSESHQWPDDDCLLWFDDYLRLTHKIVSHSWDETWEYIKDNEHMHDLWML